MLCFDCLLFLRCLFVCGFVGLIVAVLGLFVWFLFVLGCLFGGWLVFDLGFGFYFDF